MNLAWATLVVVAVTVLAVAAMLLVRRGAPEGSRFTERRPRLRGVRRARHRLLCPARFHRLPGIRSYDQSRSGAEEEALVVAQQVETAQYLGEPVREPLTGELICYGRSVIHVEWPRTEEGSQGDQINPWGVALFRTVQAARLSTPSREAAYGKWLDQTSDREAARIDRIHGRSA